MPLNIEMVFEMAYPFMNIKHMLLQKNYTNTIGKDILTWITLGNLH